MNRPVRVGVIGLGFMGRTHVAAYQSAARDGLPCVLAAVADRSAERLVPVASKGAGNFDTGASAALWDAAAVATYNDPLALIADASIDLVSICTHTDSHVPLARAALAAGKHVLVEKPVAVASTDVAALASAARVSGRLCMPAMCMRFWPGWSWVRDRVSDGSLGAVRSAAFQRLGSPPDWGTEFYADAARTGGPLVDLHIHDTDFIRFCFGAPTSVVSAGTLHHVTTAYRYAPGAGPAHVVAEGGQDHAPGFGFKMRYVIVFERATADFDAARTPTPLLLCRDGRAEPVELPAGTGYDHQVRHLVRAIADGHGAGQLTASLDEAVSVARTLEAERESLRTGLPVVL